MKIQAKCKFDFESIKALTHLSTYRKANPKKAVQLRTILYCALLFIIVAELVAFGSDLILIILIITDILAIALAAFMYFGLPRIRYNYLAKMKSAENDYIFYDDVLKVFTKSEIYNGEAEIAYSLFVKVYETSAYFFLYQTANQVFIIDKSTIEGGSAEDIRNRLSLFVKDKYIICKY